MPGTYLRGNTICRECDGFVDITCAISGATIYNTPTQSMNRRSVGHQVADGKGVFTLMGIKKCPDQRLVRSMLRCLLLHELNRCELDCCVWALDAINTLAFWEIRHRKIKHLDLHPAIKTR
jgi:hypothetical protein